MSFCSNALAVSNTDTQSGMFEPDVIVPDEFLRRGKGGLSGGERKLMSAILSDGIEAYIAQVTSPYKKRRRSTIDAREWVETKDPTYIFSFDNVCECLGIDADYLRLGLTRYVSDFQRRKLAGETTVVTWKKIRRPRKH